MADRIKGITIELNGDTTKLQSALKQVNTDISKTQASLKDVSRLLKFDPGNTDLLKQKQELLNRAIEDTKKKLETEKEALKQLQDAPGAEKTKEQQSALTREIIATEQELKRLTDQYKSFGSVAGQKLQTAGNSLKDIGSKITEIGKGFSIASAGAAALGGASIAAAKDLDNGYDIITTKTGATGEAFADLKSQMDSLFSDIPTDAETAGIAIGEVNTRFHLTGETLKAVSGDFIKFAEINGTDLNSAIDSVDSVMKKFGIDAGDVGSVLGLFTKASQDTGISIDTIEAALSKNGAAFKELGLDLTESVSLLAMMEANGVDASTSLTGFKRAVANAAKDGKTANDALKDTVDGIKNAATSTEALTIATELFGSRGAAEMSQAIREGRIDLDGLTASLSDYGGVVTSTFEATLDPWDETRVAMNNLKLAGAELGTELLTALKPAIDGIVSAVKTVNRWFSGMDDEQKKLIVTIGAVVAAIAPVVMAIGGVVSAVGTIISAVGSVISILSTVGSAIGAVVAVLGGPVTLTIAAVVAAIGGLVAAGVALYKNWDTVKAKLGQLADYMSKTWGDIKSSVSDAMSKMQDMVKDKLGNIKKAYEDNGGGIKGIVAATMTGIKEYYTLGFDALNTITGGKLNGIKDKIDTAFHAILSTVMDVIDRIKSMVGSAIDALKSIIKLPHFKMRGEFSLMPPSVPTIGVDWYSKAMENGMILNSPTIFGAMNGKLLGGGEAGSEAVVGTKSLYNMIRSAVGSAPSVTMNVYGTEGQNVAELADIVSERINNAISRKGTAWA